MTKFLVNIRAYGYHARFIVEAEDSAESIENSIVDKLGKNDIIWEDEGFYNRSRNYITYEEVINGGDDATSTKSIPGEERSRSEMGAGAS